MDSLATRLAALDHAALEYASGVVELLLKHAVLAGVSDLHLLPQSAGVHVAARRDGLLEPWAILPAAAGTRVIARLKVLAGLLTYCTDRPQEGRLRWGEIAHDVRLSVFPTLHGEQAVLRLFAAAGRWERLTDLGFEPDLLAGLKRALAQASGTLLICGPAGSGKTTTAYACLREIQSSSANGRSIATLEDPIECELPGVAQAAANPQAGLDLASGLKFLLRQDPEVLFVGEIRDQSTAELTLEGGLTGHLVLSTFHASSAAAACARLLEMGLPAYFLRGGILGVLWQRLLRRLCDCATPVAPGVNTLGLAVTHARQPVGCAACSGTGYQGRFVLAELLDPSHPALAAALSSTADAASLERAAQEAGLVDRWQRACAAVERDWTSPQEVRRLLGWRQGETSPAD